MSEDESISTAVTTLQLATAAPFDGRGQFRYLADHAVPGIELGDERHYARPVRLPRGIASIQLERDGPATVTLTTTTDNPDECESLARMTRRLLDLDADSAIIDAALATDPAMAASVRATPGIRIPGSVDAEETLFRTLIGQQISVAAARTVTGNLARALCGESGLFPTAAKLAEHGRDALRGPATRVATIIGVAEALASGVLSIDEDMSVDELTARLVAMPGIGPWTAGYVALRVLGAQDVLLTTDLVLLQGAARLGLPATSKALADYGRRWAPWRSYAGMHLWRAARSPARR